MDTTPQGMATLDQEFARAHATAARYSANNGVILLVWGLSFLLDMIGFDLSRLVHNVLPAVLFMSSLNGIILAWRCWYVRRLPIRPRQSLTGRIIFWWSWYYCALIGCGVGVWVFVIGGFPPLWFTFLGIWGALPLFIMGGRLWMRAHRSEVKLDDAVTA